MHGITDHAACAVECCRGAEMPNGVRHMARPRAYGCLASHLVDKPRGEAQKPPNGGELGILQAGASLQWRYGLVTCEEGEMIEETQECSDEMQLGKGDRDCGFRWHRIVRRVD